MHNSDRLGGSDKDAYQWAQHAATECFKEIAANQSSPSYIDKSSFGVIVILLILGGIYYLRSAINQPRELTADQIVADVKNKLDQDDPMIREQISASKISLQRLSSLIEKRAEALEESQLARVCEAYITGKLSDMTPKNFGHSYRWEIYKPSHNESYVDQVVNFHIDHLKAQEIAIKAIKNGTTKNKSLDKKNSAHVEGWNLLSWISIFKESSNNNLNEISFLKYIKQKEPDLFKPVLLEIAKEQAKNHARSLSRKKSPYSSAEEFIKKNTPFAEEIDAAMIEECNKSGEQFLNDLKVKREARALKKENRENSV